MRLRNLGLYLIGNRQAILDLAADHRCLWIGLLFVLSAGFAREYDGQDLLREPWHLLIPVCASLAASFVLFLVACGSLFLRKEGRPPLVPAYRAFLTLFWMTAPLAWLYAIPYERFLSPGDATRANFWTLVLVATWRVALMVRNISVITNRSVLTSFLLVMAIADAAALTAVYMVPKPIIIVMGGIRLTESEKVVQGATFLVAILGILSAPGWVIGSVVALCKERPVWRIPAGAVQPVSASRGMWVLAALSLLIWLPILPWTQAEQRLRCRAEEDMKAGRIADALDLMSAHAQADFPPQWDPPPREGYGETTPDILDVVSLVLARQSAPWVRAVYVDKLRYRNWREDPLLQYSSDRLPMFVRILKQLPEGPDIAAEHRSAIEARLSVSSLPLRDRESLDELLQLAEKGTPPNR
jgi:hypothetical protein